MYVPSTTDLHKRIVACYYNLKLARHSDRYKTLKLVS